MIFRRRRCGPRHYGEKAVAASQVRKVLKQLVAWPTATRMTTSESSWPVWIPRSGVRPRPRRQPTRVGEPRGIPYVTSCTVPLLPPSRLAGSGATGQEQRSLLAGHCPETGHVARHCRKVRQSEEPARQTSQRQGMGQGRGPGRSPNRRRLTRVTFSLFN